jgi:hypothetical protein
MRDNVAARPHPFPALQRLWQSHISYDSLAAASFSFLSPREAGGEYQGVGGLNDRRDVKGVVFPAISPSPSYE